MNSPRILAVSDMHGSLTPVHDLLRLHNPDILLCCGDWGDRGEVSTFVGTQWLHAAVNTQAGGRGE